MRDILMRILTLLFDSLRMEERSGSDWSENRHFHSPDAWLEGGMLELQTGEILGGNLGNLSSITASLSFRLTPTEPVKGLPVESAIRYWPYIEYNVGEGGVGPFLDFDIMASPSRYRELVTNVRHGLVPEKISIKLPGDEIYWRLDPASKWSREIWQNKVCDDRGCAAIPIENYAFSYLIKNGKA
jgi:hypothetical protein